jgi:SAM-dependent methyltransferase
VSTERTPFLPILLISTAAVAYEILLIRILSIVQWHHFAWMIISLALLGYGASGTVIALARAWLVPRFEQAFAGGALLFSVAMVLCLVLGQRVPFNALEVIWEPVQLVYLAALYLLFMVPFLFAAGCIGLAFACRGERADRIYFSDLLGAGLGAALVIAVLFLLPPQQAVVAFAGLALAASGLAGVGWRPSGQPLHSRARIMALLQVAWLACLLFIGAGDRIELRMSEFKGLAQALEVVDARVLAQRSGPLGLLSVVESPRVPFRHAPGLSFTTQHLPPAQLALFTDGDGISVINAFDGNASEGNAAGLGFLGDVTAALPYTLLERTAGHPRVLVLGAGAGYDVLLALHNGAARIDAVELNPQVAELLRGDFAEFSGKLYEHERVTLHIAEARGYVSRAGDRFDLVQVALLDSSAVAGSGTQALSESYLYTVEAFGRYLERLEPGGLLAITRWLKIPPRDNLKLAATAIEALRRAGVADPGRRLVMIRGWNTATLLVRNGEFGARDIAAVREFARQHSFDTAWYPGMPPGAANRFNRLERPWFYEGIVALLGERGPAFIGDYKFDISPSTDQKPYFFNYFKWRALPEILSLRGRGGAGLVEWGYLVLVATLAQAVLAGTLLILLPLWLSRRLRSANRIDASVRAPVGLAAYFLLLGLAFLFVEMAFIQKFILFLSHPLYAVAVVLAGFLVGAGLGSACSPWLARRLRGGARDALAAAVALLTAIVLLYLFLLPPLFERLIGYGDASRIAISLALIAPLAFCMGMPFPLGLRRLAAEAPGFIPWAWGLNGFASVVSAALATLLAIEFGFNAVLLAALTIYGAAAVLFRSGLPATKTAGT